MRFAVIFMTLLATLNAVFAAEGQKLLMAQNKPPEGWTKRKDGNWPQEFFNRLENMEKEREKFYRSLPDPLLAPWQQFPDFPIGSMYWKMGEGEDYILYFMRWFAEMEQYQRETYSERNPPPEGWYWVYERSSLARALKS